MRPKHRERELRELSQVSFLACVCVCMSNWKLLATWQAAAQKGGLLLQLDGQLVGYSCSMPDGRPGGLEQIETCECNASTGQGKQGAINRWRHRICCLLDVPGLFLAKS